MQELDVYVVANSSVGQVRDSANAKNIALPTLTRGGQYVLRIHLFENPDDMTPLDASVFQNASTMAFAIDHDYNESTTPLIMVNGGITVSGEGLPDGSYSGSGSASGSASLSGSVSGSGSGSASGGGDESESGSGIAPTIITVPIENTNSETLRNYIKNAKVITSLTAEFVARDANNDDIFVLQLEGFTVRNRVLAPGNEYPDPEPVYLGVASVNGKSGAVMLTPGSGISITETQGEGANGVTIALGGSSSGTGFVEKWPAWYQFGEEGDSPNSLTSLGLFKAPLFGTFLRDNAHLNLVAVGPYSSFLQSAPGVNLSSENGNVSLIAQNGKVNVNAPSLTASGNIEAASMTLNGETITAWPTGGSSSGSGGVVANARIIDTATGTVLDGDDLILMDTATAGEAQTLTLPDMTADAMTVTVRQLGDYGVTIAHGANEYHLTYAGDWVTLDWVAGQGWFWRA